MSEANTMLIGGQNQQQVLMYTRMANRHGMIAGATGTGKTVTMQILAEEFSRNGVPVLMADVKGDVSGLACAASPHPKIDERIEAIGITDYQAQANPVVFWDLYGKLGHPVRATVSELGPLLLSNLMDLNETQTGVLYSAFKIADDNGLMLLDLEDLQSLLGWMADNAKELRGDYGNFTSASIGAIQRDLLVLEEQDAEIFLGEPVLQLGDLMRQDFSGRGVINILDVTTVISRGPRLYATFLLWLMSELFENMPEVGDADKPKFVMFFDEAHLLFDDAPKALIDKIEQVVRLIRSKGIGVYFVSQSPLDIPEDVLGQLGLKIQHALRAFTPKEQKAVRIIAENFRENPDLDTEQVITELGIGEALVSVLDERGAPTPVERILIRPPESRIGPASEEERAEQMKRSPIGNRYDDTENRDSAHELLKVRAEQQMKKLEEEAELKLAEKERKQAERSSSRRQTAGEAMVKSIARSVGSQIGRRVIRGVLGSLFGGAIMARKFRAMETRAVHAGERRPRVEGAISLPIFQTSTYVSGDEVDYHDIRYLRLNNSPNHLVLHDKLAALEGGENALVTASGMGAITTALLSVLRSGDHLLAQRGLYGGTHTFMTHELPELGIEVDFIDLNTPGEWAGKLNSGTRAIYVESMTNPLLEVGDLNAVVEFAAANGLTSLIDNTLASPVNFRPVEIGFDLVLHSATKYLNGHSDIVAGAIIGNRELVEKAKRKLDHFGGTLDPHACFLLHRGIKTLPLRVNQQNRNALGLAQMLEQHPVVAAVHYAGLAGHPNAERARTFFSGFGGLLSFDHRQGAEGAHRVMDHLELAVQAVSLGGVETLVTMPAETSHVGLSAGERAQIGIGEGLIRVAVGVEGEQDLIEDFSQALAA